MEPLNDGSKVNVAKGQKGFIGYVVAPLWEIWEHMVLAGKDVEVDMCEPMELMHANLKKWDLSLPKLWKVRGMSKRVG